MGSWRAILTMTGLAAALLSGCVITIEPDPGSGGGGGGGGDPATTIRVRIVNTTNVGLDPKIFLSNEVLTTDELFTLGTQFTSFGFLTLGVLEPFDIDTFEVACTDAVTIGTQGGNFGDDPLNNPDGSGRVIVLTQGASVFCGDTVVLTYSRNLGGFTTTVTVEE